MQALKDNVAVELEPEDAWRSACAAGWTIVVAIAAALLAPHSEGVPSGLALLAGGLVGALTTAPLWAAPLRAAPVASSTLAEASV